MDITFEIVAGTYEEFLLGYKPTKESKKTSLVQSFATHEHSSSIRCISVSGHYLATGAADDRIVVYDMKARKEHCMLTNHNGTVTCVQFTPNRTHLMSGSSDGFLNLVRVGNWQLEKQWEKPHKGFAIISIAIHESGKLALTLGGDCTLRTWNLVKGRPAYAINLSTKCADARSLDLISWSPNGQWFSLSGGLHTEIWSIETGGSLTVQKHDCRVTSCCWLDEETVASGLENGKISVFNVSSKEEAVTEAHGKRVKCLKVHEKWIVSADSDGEIKVWRSEDMKLVAKCSSGCRITCLDVILLPKVKKEEPADVQVSNSSVTEETDLETNKKKRKKNGTQGFVVETVEDSDEATTPVKKMKKTKKKKKPEKVTVEIEDSEGNIIGASKGNKKAKNKKRKQKKKLSKT